MPPRIRHPNLQPSSIYPPTSTYKCQCMCQNRSRNFSSTPPNATRLRADMFRWLSGPGQVFKQQLPGSTNYINAYDQTGNLVRAKDQTVQEIRGRKQDEETEGEEEAEDRQEGPGRRELRKARLKKETPGIPKETAEDLMPFPMNPRYRSQPVLSEELKDAIWKRVMEEGKSVRDVSATLGVDMNRVGAVVRLKAVEKEWEKMGQTFATPYARAIQSMLPQTPYIPFDPVPHESINDLPVHRSTTRQVFHPVSESRHFTRQDAATSFDRGLLPADDRIPHPELVQMEKWRQEGVERDKRLAMQREANQREHDRRKQAEVQRAAREAWNVTKKETERSVFRFQNVKVDLRVGSDGRGKAGVGARYGVPSQDRKKGQVKIPTRVE